MDDLAHEETRDASVYARRTVSGCSTKGSMPHREAARAVMAAASCTVIAPSGLHFPSPTPLTMPEAAAVSTYGAYHADCANERNHLTHRVLQDHRPQQHKRKI